MTNTAWRRYVSKRSCGFALSPACSPRPTQRPAVTKPMPPMTADAATAATALWVRAPPHRSVRFRLLPLRLVKR